VGRIFMIECDVMLGSAEIVRLHRV
jgi:hypothetical protein